MPRVPIPSDSAHRGRQRPRRRRAAAASALGGSRRRRPQLVHGTRSASAFGVAARGSRRPRCRNARGPELPGSPCPARLVTRKSSARRRDRGTGAARRPDDAPDDPGHQAGSTGAPGTAGSRRCSHRRSRASSTVRSPCTTSRHPTWSTSATRDGHLRVNPLLLDADLVLCVTAAETVLHGGPGAAPEPAGPRRCAPRPPTRCSRPRPRAAGSLGVALELTLAARVPVLGTSLVLNPPRLTGRFRGYPYDDASLAHVARSPLRRSRCSRRGPTPTAAGSRPRADGRRRLRRRRQLHAERFFAGSPGARRRSRNHSTRS